MGEDGRRRAATGAGVGGPGDGDCDGGGDCDGDGRRATFDGGGRPRQTLYDGLGQWYCKQAGAVNVSWSTSANPISAPPDLRCVPTAWGRACKFMTGARSNAWFPLAQSTA